MFESYRQLLSSQVLELRQRQYNFEKAESTMDGSEMAGRAVGNFVPPLGSRLDVGGGG
jgi:hypothetical protein